MSKTILCTQVQTRETEWPEATEENCGATTEHEGVTWICTRERGHSQWSTRVHAAHYDQPDPFPHSVIGVAWIDEE